MVPTAGPGVWSEGIERHRPGSATLCVFKERVLGKRCQLDGRGEPWQNRPIHRGRPRGTHSPSRPWGSRDHSEQAHTAETKEWALDLAVPRAQWHLPWWTGWERGSSRRWLHSWAERLHSGFGPSWPPHWPGALLPAPLLSPPSCLKKC